MSLIGYNFLKLVILDSPFIAAISYKNSYILQESQQQQDKGDHDGCEEKRNAHKRINRKILFAHDSYAR
jgi:hypothetical protein